MGKLSEVIIPTRSIKVGESSFDVQGLSLSILADLIQNHIEDVSSALAVIDEMQRADLSEESLIASILGIVNEAPKLAAKLIVLAAGDDSEKAIEVAVSLPTPVQIEALRAVYELTIEDIGGIKKFKNILSTLGGQGQPEAE